MANEVVLKEVLSDEAFVKGLVEMETPEDVRDALNAKGAELTVEDVRQLFKPATTQAEGELDEDALEDVAGGAGKAHRNPKNSIALRNREVVKIPATPFWEW